jgi:hypothetical protein
MMRMRTSLLDNGCSIMEPDTQVALSFLSFIFAPALEGYVNLFSVDHSSGQRRTAWAPVEDLPRLESAISDFGRKGDVWFGCALRREVLPNGQRGGASDCLSIPGLWLDVDVDCPEHRRQGYAKSYDEARQVILSFGNDYDAIVRSGYGFQAWWRFTETLDAKEALPVLARWRATWEDRATRAGVEVDDVWDLPRIMRLPGTYNFKGEAGPVPATVKWRAGPIDREWATFVDDRLEPLPEPVKRQSGSSTAHLAGTRLNEIADYRKMLVGLAHCTLVRANSLTEDYHYPNAENDVSVTLYLEDDHATVWSETMARDFGLEVRRPYDKFGFFAIVKHHGDFGAAHSELINSGIPDNIYQPSGLTAQDVTRPHPETERKPSGLIVVRASDVEPREVQWLWPGWAPSGKLIVCDGDPGTGKSTMMLDIAARVTMGRSMPEQSSSTGQPSSVILLSGEDDLDDTISWRLLAAGADMRRVHHVQAALLDDEATAPVVIPRDLDLLGDLIEQTGASLMIVDVLNEYLDSKVDNYRDADIRRTLHQIQDMARRTGAAVVMLRHLRKEAGKAIYRGGGSIGIVGAARAGWTVAHHPEDASMRVLAPVKMNLAVPPIPLAFKLLPAEGMSVARVDWRGPVEGMTAETLLGDSPSNPDEVAEKRTLLEQTIAAIETILPVGRSNAMLSHDLMHSVRRATGCSERTYKSAHAKVEFGQAWREDLPSGEKGMRVWRPDKDGE